MKRKYLKMLILFATALTVMQVTARSSITYTADYSNRLYYGTDTLGGVTYSTVNYTGLFNGGEPGMPSLPIDYIRFSVPYNATNFTVSTTTSLDPIVPPLEYLIYPCQVPRLMNDTTPIVITLPDSAAYSSNYPQQRAWVESEGFLAGENRIVTVGVMPAKSICRTIFGSLTRTISAPQTINVTLSYDLSDTPSIYPIVRRDSTSRQEGYKFTRGFVVNPDSVITNAPPQSYTPSLAPPMGVPDPAVFSTDSVYYDGSVASWASSPYMIVTTPELKHSLRRLAAFKRQKGYGVRIVTMEDDVLNSSYALLGDVTIRNGVMDTIKDNAGYLRQYLKMAYSNYGTKYVLFAGNGVPYRLLHNMPSDMYYTELHEDWRYTSTADFLKNISGIDLIVGRLLGVSQQQISNYTNKLLRYELNPGCGNYSYLKKNFCSEGVDFQKRKCFINVSEQYGQLFNYTVHMKESLATDFPSGTDIINELNQTKYGYISMMNHAGPSGFIVNGKRGENPRKPYYYLWAIDTVHYVYNNLVNNSDSHTKNGLNNLNNIKYPNILYSLGCSTTPFDKAPGYDSVKVCIGESFTMGKDYGGPAFLGNTRDGYIYKEMWQQECDFLGSLINGYYQIGLAETCSKFNVTFREKLNHNLIGDPEFEVWTDEPSIITGITVERTDNSITVSGIEVDSIIVACYSNMGAVNKKVASTSEVTFNRVSPNSTIMLYKHNYLPYIVPMKLQNITLNRSQYVIASDVTAGKSIDSNRTTGNVTIPNGIDYEMEATGVVRLESGFSVEKGATFAVYPSSF